jgi:hypothetical protein
MDCRGVRGDSRTDEKVIYGVLLKSNVRHHRPERV